MKPEKALEIVKNIGRPEYSDSDVEGVVRVRDNMLRHIEMLQGEVRGLDRAIQILQGEK